MVSLPRIEAQAVGGEQPFPAVEELLGIREAKAKPGPVPKIQKQFRAIKQDHIARVIDALLAQEGAAA